MDILQPFYKTISIIPGVDFLVFIPVVRSIAIISPINATMSRRVNKNIIFEHNNYVINERREIDLGIPHYIPYNQVERYLKHIEKYKPYRIEIIYNDKKKCSLAIKNLPRNLFEKITNNYPVRINSKLRFPLNIIGVTL